MIHTSNPRNNIWLILIFIILAHNVYGMRITELMYNPEGADSGREWIELWLDKDEECVNLSEYKLFEEGVNHNIYAFGKDTFCQSAIVCNDPEKLFQDYPHLNSTFDTDIDENTTIFYKSSFSLSNTGEELAFKKNSEFIDYINYSMILEYVTVEEGYSLEYIADVWKKSLVSGGNPGVLSEEISEIVEYINVTNSTNNITNTSYIADTNISYASDNETYIEDTQNNTINNDTINNSTVESINDTSNNCEVIIKIYLKNDSYDETYIHENNVQIKFYNKLEFIHNNTKINYVNNYSIEYWIEDASGNIIKNRATTNNQDEKSFTPKIDETDKILFIRNRIKYINCTILKDEDEKIFLVKNPNYIIPQHVECECKATKCSPSTDKIPEICVEALTKKPTINTVPAIKIINVCNSSLPDKNFSSSNILSDNNIKKDITELTSQSISNIPDYSDNNSKKVLDEGLTTGMIVYESPNIKNRFYAVIGLMLVGLALIIAFVYKWHINRMKR